MNGSFKGRIADAAAGEVGSKAWVESRFDRWSGPSLPLSAFERSDLARRLADDAERAAQSPFASDKRPGRAPMTSDEFFEEKRLQAARAAHGPTYRPLPENDETQQGAALVELETGVITRDRCAAKTLGRSLDLSPDADFVRRSEAVYQSLCVAQTGEQPDADATEEHKRERETLKAQSFAIADKLVQSGRDAYRQDCWRLFAFAIHTRHLEEIPKFRRICLLPYVAAMVRAQHLRALEFWIQKHPFCRFWTFTTGQRCKVSELRTRLTELHGRISDLNAHLKKRGYAVQIVFRSSELGSIEERHGDTNAGAIKRCPETGEPLYHPHAHCVVWLPKGRLPDWQWSGLLDDIWAFWGDNWKEGDEHGGPIRNYRECVKYMFKPGEVMTLTPDELGDLHDALFKLKMVQPMGELALEIRARKKARMTLVKVETPDGFVCREVVDWNKQRQTDEQERTFSRGLALDAEKDRDFTRCMARMVPSVGPLGVKEPRIMIATSRATPDLAAIEANPVIARLRDSTRAAFCAAFIKVHKGTATVSAPFVIPAVAAELDRLRASETPPLNKFDRIAAILNR